MIGSVGLAALQEIRTFKGFEKAVIAGGFVRDSILGGDFSDIDIFVPIPKGSSFRSTVERNFVKGYKDNLMKKLSDGDRAYYEAEKYPIEELPDGMINVKTPTKVFEFGNFTKIKESNVRDYMNSDFSGLIGKFDCKYLNNIDVDIIGYTHDERTDFEGKIQNDFGYSLVQEFNFNIDKIYFDGENVVSTEEFEKDRRNKEATLCRLESVNHLVGSMRKFERFLAKYPEYIFRTDCIEIKDQEKDKSDQGKSKRKSKPTRDYWLA